MPARMTHHDLPDGERPVRDLILAYARSLDALKARGVIRSTKVLADYAEWLAAEAKACPLSRACAKKGMTRSTQTRATLSEGPPGDPAVHAADLRGQGDSPIRPSTCWSGSWRRRVQVVRAAVGRVKSCRRARSRCLQQRVPLHMASGPSSLPEVRDVTRSSPSRIGVVFGQPPRDKRDVSGGAYRDRPLRTGPPLGH